MAIIFIGKIIHTESFNSFVTFNEGFIIVDDNGKITAVGDNYKQWLESNDYHLQGNVNIIKLTDSQFLMPGFVDCHIHAPQVPQIGLGLNMPLLDWLKTYTYPLEAKFIDNNIAKNVYAKVIEMTIKNGTTLASYFGTNYKDSTIILAQEANKRGQRALIGKVCCDRNSPNFYRETTQKSIEDTKEFIKELQQLNTELIQPTITPRFAISCTPKLLTALGLIANDNNLHIQSHLSENLDEIDYVKQLFSVTSYTKVYDNFQLLTKKTIMAHGVHLEDDEITLLQERGTSIAHCPSSNTLLSSGLCDVKRLIKRGIKVGLGTDVSGGNSMSIKDIILRALEVSHHLEFIKKQEIKGTGKILKPQNMDYKPLNYKEAIYLATLGGAEALSLNKITGNFTKGKYFDALIIDCSIYPLDNFFNILFMAEEKSSDIKLLEMVEKFIYVGDDRNILKVYVAGKQIK